MARRFQKIDSTATLVASDGAVSPSGESVVEGAKWADFLTSIPALVTELQPTETEEPLPDSEKLPMLYYSTVPSSDAAIPAEAVATANGVLQHFTHTLANRPAQQGSLVVSVVNSLVTADDTAEAGVLTGGTGATLISGTINYRTGALVLDFATAPLDTKAITVAYQPASIITTGAGYFESTDDSSLIVLKDGVQMVHGTGGGKFLVTGANEITLGTAANGTARYTIITAQ